MYELEKPKPPSPPFPIEFPGPVLGELIWNKHILERIDFLDADTLVVEDKNMYRETSTYYKVQSTLEEFILGMLSLGKPLEISLVGVFETGDKVRGSRKDVDLPIHRDGEYSQKLADVQGGTYVAKEGIDIVGLYCIRAGNDQCLTLVEHPLGTAEVELKKGEALVFDNTKVMHGRRGPVGDRILMRMWVQRNLGG